MKTRTYAALIGCIAVASMLSTLAFAEGCRDGGKKKGLDDKILGKLHFVLQNEEELKLTPEQKHDLKELKKSVKKQVIQAESAIDLIKVDIHSELWNDPVNVDAINGLIDQKYELKKQNAKALVQAYATLQRTLTDEQKAAVKKMCTEASKQKMQCPMMACPMKK